MASAAPTKRRWLVWARRLAVLSLVIFAGLVATAYTLLHLVKSEPEFYLAALQIDQEEQRRQGSEMESRILDLRNSVLALETWSATFTESQINGWLAEELPRKFPELIPNSIGDPRIQITDGAVQFAFRFRSRQLNGVAVIKAEFFLTETINQLGIRIKSIQTGRLPVPLALFAEKIDQHAEQSNVDLSWDYESDDPVAILNLPESILRPADGSYLELQSLEIRDGSLAISGTTHPPDF